MSRAWRLFLLVAASFTAGFAVSAATGRRPPPPVAPAPPDAVELVRAGVAERFLLFPPGDGTVEYRCLVTLRYGVRTVTLRGVDIGP